mgnify:CR=1 FL=1
MWLYLYCPHLFLQSWYLKNYQTEPIVLVDQKHHCVTDASPQALSAGIQLGMKLSSVQALSPGCQIVSLNQHSLQQAMEAAMATLSKKLMGFSSWVSPDGQDGVYLEIATMEKLLGKPEALTQKIQQTLLPLSHMHFASAPYAKTARLLARSHMDIHLEQDNFKEYLNNLRLSRLAFAPAIEHALRKLGLKKLNQLLQLKRSDVAYRIDQDLAQELDFLLGHKKFLPTPFELPLQFYLPFDLACEAEHAQQLRFPLKHLLGQFCQYMVQHNVVAQRVLIHCFDREHKTYSIHIELARGSSQLEPWLDMLKYTLEQFKPPKAIMRLVISCRVFEAQSPQSDDFFQSPSQQKTVDGLLNKLRSRLGKESYGFLHSQPHGLPELQTNMSQSQRIPKTTATADIHNIQHSIATQPRPSAPLQPVWLLPQAKNIAMNQYEILHGPERKQGFWWQGFYGHRDYYIGRYLGWANANNSSQNKQGALHWLFRDDNNQWWLHGYFP